MSRGEKSRNAEATPAIDISLWVRLLGCHNRMLSDLRRSFEDEVTMPRFDLLAHLEREDGITLAELSRRMLVTAGNLTGLVVRSERDGVVLRRPDAHDKRLVRVWLTEEGRLLMSEAIPAHAARVSKLLSALTADERRELRRLLGKLRRALSEAKVGS